MKRITAIFCAALIGGCGGEKTEATSCDAVAKRLVEIDAGDKVSFLTEKERSSRAQRWIAKCEPMTLVTRTCVLASTTMAQANACSDRSAGAADATAKAAWVLRAGDASYQAAIFAALAADGDVIVAGDFEGTLELGGQVLTAQRTDAWVTRLSPTGTVRWAKSVGGEGDDYVKRLDLAADGSIVVAVRLSQTPHFSRVTLTADGTATSTPIASERIVDAAALHANGDVVVGSRVIEPVKGGACAAMGFVLQRFAADGERLWSRCNDGKQDVALTDEQMQLATGPDGMTAVCAGFSGPLAWGGKAAPAGGPHERVFVMALDTKGEPRWASYLGSESDVICHAVAAMDDGSVVAIVLGTAPGSALVLWEANGTQRWTRSCAELVGAKETCELSAVTVSGSDVVIAAQSGARTVIATFDSRTGAKKQASRFDDGTRINSLAARAGALVFATRFSGTVNFGRGPLEATRSGDAVPMDALIGRL